MTAVSAKPERNTYKLPRGTRLRAELRQHFSEQRRAILRYIRTGQIETKDFQESEHPRDEHGQFASTGAGHHFGKSKAKIKIDPMLSEGVFHWDVERLFGKKATFHDLASIVGATDEGIVTIDTEETRYGPDLTITTKHKNYQSDRSIKKDKNGKTYMVAETFIVAASERGKGNYGPQVFGRMVENAAAAGIDRIMTTAARSDFQNGYYTWARFGYDAPLTDEDKAKLPEALKSANRISDLMESESGRNWWKTNGDTKTMKFDLKPGSKSMRVWKAYLEAKANVQTSAPKTWQRRTSLGTKSLLRTKEQEGPAGYLPWSWPTWDTFRLGALSMSKRMTPMISAVWQRAGQRFASYVGMDPDRWEVTNPHLAEKIRNATLSFCDSTNQTTSEELDVALAKTRAELNEGVVNQGESIPQLTKRVNAIFDKADKKRARAIAQTETARAVHAAQDEAAKQSGVVYGWRWLPSSDACDVCLAIAARCPTVKLGQPFAIIGHNPQYKEIKYPPAHVHCNCTVQEILDTDPTPAPTATLEQPGAVTDEEYAEIGRRQQESYDEILAGSVAWGAKPRVAKPGKPPKPKPAPKVQRRNKPETLTTIGEVGADEFPGGEALPRR